MRQQWLKRAEKALNILVIILLDAIVNVKVIPIVVKLPHTIVSRLSAQRKRPKTSEYGL
jgi:hypothetical protein